MKTNWVLNDKVVLKICYYILSLISRTQKDHLLCDSHFDMNIILGHCRRNIDLLKTNSNITKFPLFITNYQKIISETK